MALKLLVADPDEDWLYATKEHFEKLFYKVEVVSNGKDVQLALYNEKFFAVVLNLDTKNHNGAQVLKFIKTNHAVQTVILVINRKYEDEESRVADYEKYRKLGATEVLFMPFEYDALKSVLEGHQSVGELMSSVPRKNGVSEEVQCDIQDDKFTSVKISEFYTSQPVLFDIFIKLKSNRYIKILHAGDSFSSERLDKYKDEKGVEYLYFQKTDLGKFVKFNNYVTKKIISNEKVGSGTKVKMMQNVASKYLEQTFTEGLKPQIVDQGKEVCENIFNLVENETGLYQLLRNFQDFDPNAYSHAFLVTLFATSIIKQFEWQSKTTIETAAMACMFHDIGMMKLPPELLEMKEEDMSEEQLELYQTHPNLGAELVESNRLINNSVKQIILQHHEHYDGSGYPFAKRGSKILTLANIVCLADSFVHIIMEEDLKPVDALKSLLNNREMLPWYNSAIVENLIKVFVDPHKIVKENNLPSNSRVVNKKVS